MWPLRWVACLIHCQSRKAFPIVQPAKPYRALRLVLGDQLHAGHSWFRRVEPDVLYLIAEMRQETGYVRHHVQKLCAFFSAMALFAGELARAGHQVLHLTLDDTENYSDFIELVQAIGKQHGIQRFEFQLADEYRLRQQLRGLQQQDDFEVVEVDSEHFLLLPDELSDYVNAGRHNRMETFYRKMRRRFDILMDGDQPVGGRWNFDSDNREPLRARDLPDIPEPLVFDNDVGEILERLDRHQVDAFGDRVERLPWPVTRSQGLELLDWFCRHGLPRFGRFQDAMTCQHPAAWSLYHSRLSFAMNAKLLHPREVIDRAIASYHDDALGISIAQVEGFVRQIIGWREYVRAVYWMNMPGYAELNSLQATRDLPEYFWGGAPRMNCLRHALGQSLEKAYAHHIQRLMIIGNFCLIAGIDPDQVDAWYLGVYVDAIEWVEMPNTRGMSQFADGGLVATKPYSAGGNYVNRMSDYCKHCEYDVRDKAGSSACPLNSLYWAFMIRHRERLAQNPRIGMLYRNWDGQDAAQREATLSRAEWCLEHLDEL